MADVVTAVGTAKEIAEQVRLGLQDKRFELTCEPDSLSTEGDCPESCRSHHKTFTWNAHEGVDLILRFDWTYLELGIYWVYDGCNVQNAYVFVSTKSFIRWFADGDHYKIKVRGETSTETSDTSGCKECCEHAKCVTFHIDIDFLGDSGTALGHGHSIVTLCGDGNDPKVEEV